MIPTPPPEPSKDAVLSTILEQTNQTLKALLADRKSERRKTYAKYAVLALMLLSGASMVDAIMAPAKKAAGQPGAAGAYASLVKIEGEIAPGSSSSAMAVNANLEKAFADPGSSAVIMLINSPGGTPVQSSIIHAKVTALKAKYNKPVVALGEDMMTSGAYMVAVAADKIVAEESSVVGSIGVVSRGFGFTGLMDKLGVERRVHTAGLAKNTGDPFSPQSEGDVEASKLLMADIHQSFIAKVKLGRAGKLQEVPNMYSGAVWTGNQAKTLGLIDELGNLSSVKASLNVDTVKVYGATPSLFRSLAGELSSTIKVYFDNSSMVEQLPSLSSDFQ